MSPLKISLPSFISIPPHSGGNSWISHPLYPFYLTNRNSLSDSYKVFTLPHFILRDEKSCQNACVSLLTATKPQILTFLLRTYKGKKRGKEKAHCSPGHWVCSLWREFNHPQYCAITIPSLELRSPICTLQPFWDCLIVSCFLSFSKVKLKQ